MAESQKGTSPTANSKNKCSLLDEDFGDDFLSSWKSAKVEKADIDFGIEKPPKNKKKTFNFDKLDDFELGGDFDKLSSFKLDMPDLDFSSPLKKTEKAKGKSCEELDKGKTEPKQDKISFTFDFNELEKFGLNSNLLKGEKESSKCSDDSGLDRSFKHNKHQEPVRNSVLSTDVFEDNETKRFQVSESMDISKSEYLVKPINLNSADPSTSLNNGQHDVSCETVAPTDKKMTEVEENKYETYSREENKQHSDGTSATKPYIEKAKQDFCLQSVSDDISGQEILPQFGTGFASLDHVMDTSARGLDDTARSLDSSQSRNSSPTKSYDSGCCLRASVKESSNTSNSQKCQGNLNEVTGGSTVLSESRKYQKDVENASATIFSLKNACALKYSSDNKNSSSKLLPALLHRGSALVKTMLVKVKETTALQLKPLIKPVDNVSLPTSVLTPKRLYSVDSGKIKAMDILPANENSLQITPSNLPGQTASRNIGKSILPNLVSGTVTIKSSQKIDVGKHGIAAKDEKICNIPNLKVSGRTKLDINLSNSPMQKETQPVRFLESNSNFPINSASKVSSSIITDKHAVSSPPLKRKTHEESKAYPYSSNPLKRVKESTIESRKVAEVSPKNIRKASPRTRKPEACQDNVSIDIQTSSNGVLKVGSMTEFEVPILIENDGNVEKAEACAKELDDICNMLRKKYDEAKELLVRAIVNNNTLLMLNHPIYEEKISALQRFANSLQSKEF